MNKNLPRGQVILYKTADDKTKVEVKLTGETVWLAQGQMAALFGVDMRTVNEHLKNIFKTVELSEKSVIRNFRITSSDGKTHNTKHYNLDAISKHANNIFSGYELDKQSTVSILETVQIESKQ